MKVAVTACSGRLGHAILRRLPAVIGADNVIGIARQPERINIDGIGKRAGDYGSVDGLVTALRGVDSVIMISAPVTVTTDRATLHRNVITAARRAGVRRVLYTGVIGNGTEEGTFFHATQQVNRQAETDLAASGLGWVVGRNALYLELDVAQMLRAAGDTGVYTNPGGEGRCPYVTIDELAFAWTRLAADDRHDGRTWNLVGESKTQAELVAQAAQTFGITLRYEPISDDAMIEKFRRLMPERGDAVARMLTGAFQCIRKGAFDVPSDFEAATGRPCRSIAAMMEDIRRQRAASA